MKIIYKKLTETELKDFYLRHMADGTFVSWLAMDAERFRSLLRIWE